MCPCHITGSQPGEQRGPLSFESAPTDLVIRPKHWIDRNKGSDVTHMIPAAFLVLLVLAVMGIMILWGLSLLQLSG